MDTNVSNLPVLFLLVNSYPFGVGEEFIEDEIEYLSVAYKEVLLITFSTDLVQTRTLPANFRLVKVEKSQSFLTKVKNFFSGFRPLALELLHLIKNYGLSLDAKLVRQCLGVFLRYEASYAQICRIIKNQFQGDTICFYAYWMDGLAYVIARCKKAFPESSAYCRAHAYDIYPERHYKGYLPFLKYKLDNLDRIFFVSAYGLDAFLSHFPWAKIDRLSVAHLGVKEQRQVPITDSHTLRILSIGYLIRGKRIDLLAESLCKIKTFQIRWYHIGQGQKDGKVLLKEVADKIGASSNIEFHPLGNLLREEVMEFYRTHSIDLFVSVSESEGLPVSMMECCSFGIPIISTNVGGVSELVVTGYNGELLSSNPDAQEIAAALERFYFLPLALKKSLRDNALETWRTKFNADRNYMDFISLMNMAK